MLRRLLKYELQATARTFLPLYLILFLMAVVNKIFLSINSYEFSIPAGIAMTAYVSFIVAIFVITLVVTIQRFYKNLLTDEGYLMFTLPASVDSLIISKLLVAALWNVLCLVLSMLSVFVLATDPESFYHMIKEFTTLWGELLRLNISLYAITFEAIVLMILSLFASVLNLYAAIGIGHLVTKHRVAGSLGAFFGMSLIQQILFTTGVSIADKSGFLNQLDSWNPADIVQLVLVGCIAVVVVLSVIFYFTTRYILKNKLNLE